MRKIWKAAVTAVLLCILCIFPAHAAEKEDEVVFGENGQYGSVYGEAYTNEAGETTNWLTIKPGDRGIRIVNDENQEIITVDKYGGIYLNGEFYVNGEKYGVSGTNKGIFSPEDGFLYLMIVVCLGISIVCVKKVYHS